ncbi:hypothetical protein [Paenibacillus sp. GbtcB18]|uniref:hypothetical protein n=1 Tax=Paenibacillus sp. GbtcB18 TaxID=2824763 RepID=UPI0020C5F2B4|nr:hypothetical protein [Paenibacillus sp. GbtcB18]
MVKYNKWAEKTVKRVKPGIKVPVFVSVKLVDGPIQLFMQVILIYISLTSFIVTLYGENIQHAYVFGVPTHLTFRFRDKGAMEALSSWEEARNIAFTRKSFIRWI